jgi:hypothetical protein
MDLKKPIGTMKTAALVTARHPVDTGLKVVGRTIGLVRGSAVAVASAVSGGRHEGPAERPTAAPAPADTADTADRLSAPDEVETPVGTTGAGEGYNPDTGETDLQQPGTEPLMDPSTTKAVASESETLRRAADRDL